MTGAQVPWRLPFALALLLAFPLFLSLGMSQTGARYNEREVKQPVTDEKLGVWVLDFRFKDPRLITVDIPGRGKRLVWYLWYQVINNTKEPRTFIPDFELVTQDKNTVHHDQVFPKAQEAIRRIEDPTGYLDIKNSVTIAAQLIPPSKQEAAPRAVTGVATWDDVNPDSNHFSIFVSGLSNGWSVDDKQVVRRKTLQLNFKRVGDKFHQDSRDIRFMPPAEWLYRASALTVPAAPPKEKEGETPKTGAAPKPLLDPLVPMKTASPR